MKKSLLLILFLTANFTFAQFSLKNPTAVSLNTGFFLPYSSEVFNTGVSIGMDIQHKISPAYLFFVINYNISSRKEILPNQYFNNTSGTGILEVLGGVRLYFSESKNLKYFFDCGLGLYVENKGSYEMRVDNVSYSYKGVSNGTIGGNIGVGADYPINKDFDLVGRIKYHLYFGVGEDPFINPYFGITAGLKYNIKF
jgi:hypothetical protein